MFFIASTSVKHHMFTSWDSVEANGATFQWGRTTGFLISTGAVNMKYNNLSVCYAHKGIGRTPNDAQFARLWYNRTEIHSLQVCPVRGDNPKFASEGCVYSIAFCTVWQPEKVGTFSVSSLLLSCSQHSYIYPTFSGTLTFWFWKL